MMKACATIFIGSLIFVGTPYSAKASTVFNDKQRAVARNYAQSNLQAIHNDEHIQACWVAAGKGDDRALAALYLIATGMNNIDSIAKKRRAILASGKDIREIGLAMKTEFNEKDVETLKRSMLMLPKSWKYCQSVAEKLAK